MVQPINPNQVKSEFLTELKQLLYKYGAEIEVLEQEGFYGLPYMNLTIPAIYSKSGDAVRDFVCESIGSHLNGDSKI